MFTAKRLGSAAALAALVLLAAACGNGGGGEEAGGSGTPKLIGDGTLKVGYVLPETGQLAFLGPPQTQRMKLDVAQINAGGGVLGKQILKGLIEAGYGPGKVGVYGADGLRSEELPKLVDPKNPAVLAGMKGTAPASAENARFTAALKRFDPVGFQNLATGVDLVF